ncbi:MAG: TIGR04211 family SH3 domain-containing protein [Pseudomonadota bacterium]
MIKNLLYVVLLAPSLGFAQSAWVSDQFEITLRTGPSTSNAVRMSLGSGMRLEVLQRDDETGYTQVRTPGGTEGWVLTRYLMNEASAREQLQELTAQLTSAASEGSSLEAQLAALRGEYQDANRTINSLENDKQQLEQDIAEIRRTAANALSLDSQNRDLRDKLADAEIQVATLEQENRTLSGQSNRYWFMTGSGVIIVGIILGLCLPRLKMPRRSRYDRF